MDKKEMKEKKKIMLDLLLKAKKALENKEIEKSTNILDKEFAPIHESIFGYETNIYDLARNALKYMQYEYMDVTKKFKELAEVSKKNIDKYINAIIKDIES
ncbi:hypothetical protein GF358_01575 [Candidatus Woesearchaeota archaeon]|nr:hypothetical protein [Candidatus Woesearchaeota archaeon]